MNPINKPAVSSLRGSDENQAQCGELIQGIEAGYIPEERQFKNLSVGNPDDTITPGLTGNAWFTSSQLERLKRFKAARQVIYREAERAASR
jgi:hypothetical protein